MLAVFLITLALGLLVFFIAFKKEFTGFSSNDDSEMHLRDVAPPKESVQVPSGANAVRGPVEDSSKQDNKENKATDKDQIRLKLEQMLQEKNRDLTRLEGELKNEHGHRNEFEGVKEILQQQVEEMKLQNKQLKEEMSRILEDNLSLQAKIVSLEKTLGGHKTGPFVQPSATSIKPVQGAPLVLPEPGQSGMHPNQGGLSLHDVFGAEEEQK